jgi:hypothetical protein
MARRASDTLPADMTNRPVLELFHGDVLRLRRPHPCGGTDWLVDRLGADIGLTCQACGRHVLIARRQLERRIAGFVRRGPREVPATRSDGPTHATPDATAAGMPDVGDATPDAAAASPGTLVPGTANRAPGPSA